jgi:hypothetical protein
MSWFDDISARISEVVPEGVRTDIGAYLQARVVDPVVKIGQPQTGNLSAEQLAAGARGGAIPVAGPSSISPASQNAMQASMIIGGVNIMPMIAIGAVGILAVVLLSRRSRG